MQQTQQPPELSALGTSKQYRGLEAIPITISQVEFTSDEVTALCPITGQPDYYTVRIKLRNTTSSLESKSLKLYLGSYRDMGIFAEDFAQRIYADVVKIVNPGGGIERFTTVTVTQKSRGGITLVATAGTVWLG